MTISSPACVIDETGISAPSFTDILTYYQNQYSAIVGQDGVIAPDSMIGQLISLQAYSQSLQNADVISVYNGFSPYNALGNNLSSLVKINGLARLVPSESIAIIRCTGTAGTEVNNGVVRDTNGNLWNLGSFTIPSSTDYIDITAVCQTKGLITAPLGSINEIYNPTAGWQTAISIADAVPGNPVESDYDLRIRRNESTSYPAVGTTAAIYAGLKDIPSVSFVSIYENSTSSIDSNGIPGKSICCVVDGGDANAIANVIATKKSVGCGTYGKVTEEISIGGNTIPISFTPVGIVNLSASITIKALSGYTATIGASIGDKLAAYVNSLGIGQDVWINNSIASIFDKTYNVVSFSYSITSDLLGTTDAPSIDGNGNVIIPYDAIAIASSTIALTVT